MTERESSRAERAVKTIRVTAELHARFLEYQYDGHFRNASIAMESLLAPNVVHIPVPADVLERWKAEAEEAGYPLEAWAVQRIESGMTKCIFHAMEVRDALEELAQIKRALLAAGSALGAGPIEHGDGGE